MKIINKQCDKMTSAIPRLHRAGDRTFNDQYYTSKTATTATEPKNDDSNGEDEDKPSIKEYLIGLARDILIAVIVMVIVIGSLCFYTGNWPPMVVIESDSMMHSDDSDIGIIDTGDLVLVKSVDSQNDVKSYVEGKKSNYKTYGTYGNVIIFRKNGLDDTPVIHRAVIWLEYNASGYHLESNGVGGGQSIKPGSFDVPSRGLFNQSKKIHIEDYVPNHLNLTIDLNRILTNFEKSNIEPHSGFVTKGDGNDQIDQGSLPDSRGRPLSVIKIKWIVGKAVGEMPWFGLIKLYISGQTERPESEAPPTSVNMLILSIVLIIAIPIVLDLTFSYLGKLRKRRREQERDEVAGHDGAIPEEGDRFRPRTGEKSVGARSDERLRGYAPDIGYDRQSDRGVRPRYDSPDRAVQITKDDLLKKIK